MWVKCVKISIKSNLYHCSVSAVRTTSPTSPTETSKPSAHAPSWSSRVTTPAIPSGWATRRRRLCGTMTPCAPIGGVPTRPWKGPTCCRLPTRMNSSAGQTRRTCRGQKATRSERQMLGGESVPRLYFSPVSRRWRAQCHLNWTRRSMSASVSHKRIFWIWAVCKDNGCFNTCTDVNPPFRLFFTFLLSLYSLYGWCQQCLNVCLWGFVCLWWLRVNYANS